MDFKLYQTTLFKSAQLIYLRPRYYALSNQCDQCNRVAPYNCINEKENLRIFKIFYARIFRIKAFQSILFCFYKLLSFFFFLQCPQIIMIIIMDIRMALISLQGNWLQWSLVVTRKYWKIWISFLKHGENICEHQLIKAYQCKQQHDTCHVYHVYKSISLIIWLVLTFKLWLKHLIVKNC